MTRPGGGDLGRIGHLDAAALPACLRDIPRPVARLWYLGDPTPLATAPLRHVAIVGTREASPYGIRVAEQLAAAAAGAGYVVVSGLARGIDAAAHRAALAAGGATIGVQGTGVDVPYPASHRALHAVMAERGTVVSEFEPGALASPGCFPRRNRIIAALCRVVVVVEAGFKSGAINTASQALELDRVVAAVPGRIDEDRAAGSNHLIRDGAQVIASPGDLLGLLDLSTSIGAGGTPRELTPPSRSLSSSLSDPSHATGSDEDRPPHDPMEAMEALPFRLAATRLIEDELAGVIERDGAWYRRGRGR